MGGAGERGGQQRWGAQARGRPAGHRAHQKDGMRPSHEGTTVACARALAAAAVRHGAASTSNTRQQLVRLPAGRPCRGGSLRLAARACHCTVCSRMPPHFAACANAEAHTMACVQLTVHRAVERLRPQLRHVCCAEARNCGVGQSKSGCCSSPAKARRRLCLTTRHKQEPFTLLHLLPGGMQGHAGGSAMSRRRRRRRRAAERIHERSSCRRFETVRVRTQLSSSHVMALKTSVTKHPAESCALTGGCTAFARSRKIAVKPPQIPR